MRRLIAIAALGLALALCPGPAHAAPGDDPGCRSCHKAMTSPMPPPGKGSVPPLSCTACHGGDGAAREIGPGHAGLIANPSALDQAPGICGRCHAPWPERVRRSPMATAMGVINMTRYLWGAQPDAGPRFGVRAQDGLAALPSPVESGRAVDDLLRRRCLRCHLWVEGADIDGARRSAGCAACHRPTDDQGRRPPDHGLTRKVPVSQCLRCHAGCGVGTEYVGRIPRDARESARFLAEDPERPRLWQARAWRPMRPDLHHEAGLACQDCHPRSEIMGDGKIRPSALASVGVRCSTCHGRPGRWPDEARTTLGAVLTNARRQGEAMLVTGKLDGRKRRAPLLAGGEAAPVAHQVPGHERVACHACHAGLNPAAWGYQVLLETRRAYELWAPIAAQGDPQLWQMTRAALALPREERPLPAARDYLSGERRPGVWIATPFFRRFEWRVYGRTPDGRAMLLAPRFQYVITRLDDQGRLLESAQTPSPGLGLLPWAPHATRRATMGCAGCHGSPLAAGLGLTMLAQGPPEGPDRLAPPLWQPQAEGLPQDWTRAADRGGRPLQAFPVAGSGSLTGEVIRRLVWPGKEYQAWFLRALKEEWPWSEMAPGADQGEPGPGKEQGPGR